MPNVMTQVQFVGLSRVSDPVSGVSVTSELPRATQRIPKYVGDFAVARIVCRALDSRCENLQTIQLAPARAASI